MQLFHVSPSSNDESISRQGILTSYSQLAHQRIYVTKREWLEWAIRHIRDKYDVQCVTVWVLKLHHKTVKRVFDKIYYTERDILADKITGKLAVTSDCTVLI